MYSFDHIALVREAAIAGQSLSIGLSFLKKANYAQTGLYSAAFFNLSIGLERQLKLIFIISHLLKNNHFPNEKDLKKLGHNISILFQHAVQIKIDNNVSVLSESYKSNIENRIILFLSEFATKTRYYNLAYLTEGTTSRDPIEEWFTDIGGMILKKHYTPSRKMKVETNAKIINEIMSRFTIVSHIAENGTHLDNALDASEQTGKSKIIQKYATFHAARICRFNYQVLYFLQGEAHQQGHPIPYLDELFFPFYNDDAYLLSRKTFPPRGQ